jgi:hypothetical protein
MHYLMCTTVLKFYLKTLNFFKKFFTTDFGLYGHHQELKLLWCGNSCSHFALFLVWSHVCAGVSLGDMPLTLWCLCGNLQVLTLLWCGNCFAHLFLFLVRPHVCAGVSPGDMPLSLSLCCLCGNHQVLTLLWH